MPQENDGAQDQSQHDLNKWVNVDQSDADAHENAANTEHCYEDKWPLATIDVAGSVQCAILLNELSVSQPRHVLEYKKHEEKRSR